MFPKGFDFCLFINYAYICLRTRRNFKETALQGNITWPTLGKQNVQAKEVYWMAVNIHVVLPACHEHIQGIFKFKSKHICALVKSVILVLTLMITPACAPKSIIPEGCVDCPKTPIGRVGGVLTFHRMTHFKPCYRWFRGDRTFMAVKQFTYGEQGWRSGESTRFPQMSPRFNSHTWHSLLVLYSAPRGFSPVLRFSPLLKNQHLIWFDLI